MSVPNASELEDDQIEALIRKLSAIKGSAPELIAALEAEAQARQAGKGRGGRAGGGRGRKARSSRSYEEEEEDDPYADDDIEEEDDDEEDDDEEDDDDDEEETDSEEDDEFDEDGPCVGHGYSDEVSVISEMTTPTVVSNFNVPEEERYNELQHGYGGRPKSNKPDLLSQVNRAANAQANKNKANKVAAAANMALNDQKRKTYASGLATMAKISETGETAVVSKPPQKTASRGTAAAAKKTTSRRPSNDGSGSGSGSAGGGSGRRKPGLRRNNSPPRDGEKPKKKVGTKKSSGSGGGSRRDINNSKNNNSAKSADAFSNEWQTSFNADAATDDNGFPFKFGDEDGKDNAFTGLAGYKNTKNKSASSGGGGVDSFDPFNTSNGDPFATAKATFENNNSSGFGKTNSGDGRRSVRKTPSTGTGSARPRRTSGVASGRTKR